MTLQYETIFYQVMADNILTIALNRADKLNAVASQVMLDPIDTFDRADASNEG
jgi:enoyl-CoA hydratase/carnithine racemase